MSQKGNRNGSSQLRAYLDKRDIGERNEFPETGMRVLHKIASAHRHVSRRVCEATRRVRVY